MSHLTENNYSGSSIVRFICCHKVFKSLEFDEATFDRKVEGVNYKCHVYHQTANNAGGRDENSQVRLKQQPCCPGTERIIQLKTFILCSSARKCVQNVRTALF